MTGRQVVRGTDPDSRHWSAAEWLGIATFAGALALALISPRLVVVPLAAFVLICLVLPFFSGISFYFKVISRGVAGSPDVCLSFDDGPDPVSTPALLTLLRQHRIRAIFFVTGERAKRHPRLIEAMLADGHSIGNHSYSHDNFIMFRSSARLVEEIESTQRVLGAHGLRPRLFRPPVGILTPRYSKALRQTGLIAVTFSRRAGDRGNRNIRGLAERILRRLQPGDIVLLHDTAPRRSGDLQLWLNEIEQLISGIGQRHLAIVPMETLIGQPVMTRCDPVG